MYEQLIKRLRCPKINSCPMDNNTTCRKCQRNIYQESADAIEYLSRCLSGRARWHEIERLLTELERIKKDAAPVVQCKDCVYFELDKENADNNNWYHNCRNTGCGVRKMDFCSFGEPKEDNL